MRSLLSKFCNKVWLYLVYTMGFIMLLLLLKNWSSLTIPQKLICLLAAAIPVHIFEENTCPGGFFYMNNLTFGSQEPTVYPQNRLTNMITNLGAETVFILLTINSLKMEAAVTVVVIFFGIAETVNHTREGIGMYQRYKDRGKRSIYAPGLVSSLFLLLPMAIGGIAWMSGSVFTVADVIAGIGISVGIAVCLILLPFAISIKVKSKEFSFKKIGYFKKYEELQ
ncbi:HXXEE domain-containing protein [Hungatella hathewayi]|uniref:HXXEE domain-containing protein n=2 Tax=Lachnospiraceae TaxID=186803 RepID=A0AAW9WMQ6_9FIRM|nr:HXXEE domain-containing protein [Hungatella hathewayi]CUQ52293.1 Uncharacterised protein [Hungatella hathewayi]